MRWWTVLLLISVSGAWGYGVNYVARGLFAEHLAAYLAFLFVGCFGGGCLLGWAWSKLTWPARRRELRRQFGLDDERER